jgi:hypothetical protein
MSETLKAALEYAKRGWQVIPVHSVQPNGFCSCGAPGNHTTEPKHNVGKEPYVSHRHGSSSAMQINTWWLQWPDANVAVVTGSPSDLIVLDVDPRNGGNESLAKLEKLHGKLPKTPLVHSGGGGKHYYFSHPGFEVRGRRGMLPGLDVKADGGEIVAPPSNHLSNVSYEWDKESGFDIKLAKIPDWLLKIILEKQSKRPLKSTLTEEEKTAPTDAKIAVFPIRAGGSLLSRRAFFR